MNPPRPAVRQQSEQAFAAALDELEATFEADDALFAELPALDPPEATTKHDDAPNPRTPNPTTMEP
jgi:hypothetical protein